MPTSAVAVPLLPAQHPGPAWGLTALASGGGKLMGTVGEMGAWLGHVGLVC